MPSLSANRVLAGLVGPFHVLFQSRKRSSKSSTNFPFVNVWPHYVGLLSVSLPTVLANSSLPVLVLTVLNGLSLLGGRPSLSLHVECPHLQCPYQFQTPHWSTCRPHSLLVFLTGYPHFLVPTYPHWLPLVIQLMSSLSSVLPSVFSRSTPLPALPILLPLLTRPPHPHPQSQNLVT